MLVLQNVQEPTENVRWAQHQVGAFWERQMLGQGSLILTDSKVVWISESTRTGFVLTYPAIAVHAAASANEEFPEPHLFLMVDASKTDVNYTPDRTDVEEEDDEDDVKTASVRFVPADSSVVHQLYQIMNECQELNPDPEEEISDEGGDEEELELSAGHEEHEDAEEEMDSSAQWYTSETPDGEVILSPEGRANLERIMGDFEQPPPAPGRYQNGNDDTMDE